MPGHLGLEIGGTWFSTPFQARVATVDVRFTTLAAWHNYNSVPSRSAR